MNNEFAVLVFTGHLQIRSDGLERDFLYFIAQIGGYDVTLFGRDKVVEKPMFGGERVKTG